jgi:hypothetical protein
MSASKPMIQKLNRGVTGSDVEGFAPVSHGGAEVADEIDRGGSASLHNYGGIARFFGSDTMSGRFCPGSKQGFENSGIESARNWSHDQGEFYGKDLPESNDGIEIEFLIDTND